MKKNLTSPLATQTQNGAMIIDEKYIIRGAVCQQWLLAHVSQLRGAVLSITDGTDVPEADIPSFDANLPETSQARTRTGLIKVTIENLKEGANTSDFGKLIDFASAQTAFSNARKANNEARASSAPANTVTRTPVRRTADPLIDSTGNGTAPNSEDNDDEGVDPEVQAALDAAAKRKADKAAKKAGKVA